MARKFKHPDRQRMYVHYRHAEIKRNIQSSDRRLYWFGRFGATAQVTRVSRDMFRYPAWAAGYDRFLAEGPPDFDILANAGRSTVRACIEAVQGRL